MKKICHLYNNHSDHLGSSTFLTDESGKPRQYLLYLPFGETLLDQKAGGYDSRYKFTGKETDENTGLNYHGARYYNPGISMWYGVDPLIEDYPAWSPFNYVMGNPIRLIDPTGMSPENGGENGDPPKNVLPEVTVTAQREKGIKRDNLSPINIVSQTFKFPQINQELPTSSGPSFLTQAGPYLTWGGILFSGIGELKYSSPRLGYGSFSVKNPIETWIGKDLNIYSGHTGRGPNQWSGSRGAAMAAARPFKIIGTILGVINYFSIYSSYVEGYTSGYNTVWEMGSNTISTFGGLPGVGWGIGWELGRYTTSRPYYRKNIRPKLQSLFGIKNDEYWYCAFCGKNGQWMPYPLK